jgi:hypothetical protein
MRTTTPLRSLTLLAALAGALAVSTCESSPTDLEGTTLAEGTWGGDDAGAIVTSSLLHVHFGCTNGDFPAPVVLDADGRFSVSGEYLVQAYPVALGPTMPAQVAGVVRGRDLTMTVAVNDTIEKKLVVFGPATVRLGREPQMGPCPICVTPSRAYRPLGP